jgi:hypothetical protein
MALMRDEVAASLLAAGWRIDAEEPHAIEASGGHRFGVAVFFEDGLPVEVCYGDGDEDLQHQESWHEAPGILSPTEVGRLFPDTEREDQKKRQKVDN